MCLATQVYVLFDAAHVEGEARTAAKRVRLAAKLVDEKAWFEVALHRDMHGSSVANVFGRTSRENACSKIQGNLGPQPRGTYTDQPSVAMNEKKIHRVPSIAFRFFLSLLTDANSDSRPGPLRKR